MTDANRLIEDDLTRIAAGIDGDALDLRIQQVEEQAKLIRQAAEQINVWRRFAKTAYSAFSDLYAVCEEGDRQGRPADAMHGDDWKRITSFKNEVDKCRAESKEMEKKQGR